MSSTSKYWAERTARSRLVSSEQLALGGMVDIISLYRKSLSRINQDINNLFQKYSKEVGLDVMELTEVLTGSERKQFLLNIQKKMIAMGFELDDVYKPEYISRITRLEALKERIYWEIANTNLEVEREMTALYKRGIYSSYDEIMADYVGDKYQYHTRAFSSIHKGALEQLLKERWSGQNYKESVWGGRTDLIARDIPYKLNQVYLQGRSYAKVAGDIREEYLVSMSSATRLIRTESAYFTGQAELQAMLDLGIEKYEYYAVMDMRTSDICKELNGETFYYKDALVGENYPPMHPNCRSRPMPLLDNEENFDREREIYIEDMEASDSVEVLNSDQLNAYDYESAYKYILDKHMVVGDRTRGEWLQGKDGTFTLLLDETDSKVTLSAIATQVKGTGLGSKIMEDLKEYSNASAKLLEVVDIQNVDFFNKFNWLEYKESVNRFIYAPLEEDIKKYIKESTPLIREKNKSNN